MITFDAFIAKHKGYFREYNGDIYRHQCMDLFWLYLKEVLGIDPRPYQGWGTAKNCYNNFEKIKDSSKYFVKIQNTPNNTPQKGDIVFWGTYLGVTGFAGHVGVYSDGNLYTFISFDQNYPTGQPCKLVQHGSNKWFHGYRGVMGWLHPK